jgi:ribosome-binding protein aMBF1 (putative translation factor)
MNAMIDVQCACGKRFGWQGNFADRPPCPRCGARPPQAELDASDLNSEEDEQRRRTDPLCAAGDVLRQQRVDAGLSLRQAATKLEVGPAVLSSWEQGRARVPESYARKMVELYGLHVPERTT